MKRINEDMDTANLDKIKFSLGVVLGHESGCLPEAISYLDEQKDAVEGHLSHYLKKRSYQKAWQYFEAVGINKLKEKE